jgi:uncharacterized protein YpuA (DUF1002 family)
MNDATRDVVSLFNDIHKAIDLNKTAKQLTMKGDTLKDVYYNMNAKMMSAMVMDKNQHIVSIMGKPVTVNSKQKEPFLLK